MRRYENLWSKRQLVPTWIIQCIASGLFAVSAGLILAAFGILKEKGYDSDDTYYGYSWETLENWGIAYGAILLVAALGTIIFDIIEAVFYHRRVLSPVILLVFAVIKTTVWGGYTILVIVSAAKGNASWSSILFSLSLTMSSIYQLTLGASYTHSLRKGNLDTRGTYKPTKTGHVETGYMPNTSVHEQPVAYGAYGLPVQQQELHRHEQQHQQGGLQNPFNDQTYRSTSPVPSAYSQDTHAYTQQGVELQMQPQAHHH